MSWCLLAEQLGNKPGAFVLKTPPIRRVPLRAAELSEPEAAHAPLGLPAAGDPASASLSCIAR